MCVNACARQLEHSCPAVFCNDVQISWKHLLAIVLQVAPCKFRSGCPQSPAMVKQWKNNSKASIKSDRDSGIAGARQWSRRSMAAEHKLFLGNVLRSESMSKVRKVLSSKIGPVDDIWPLGTAPSGDQSFGARFRDAVHVQMAFQSVEELPRPWRVRSTCSSLF